MARRRGPQRGHLYSQAGLWKLRYTVYGVGVDGKPKNKRPVWIAGRSEGVGKITKKRAMSLAAEYMAEVNRKQLLGPQGVMTIAEFIQQRFEPDRFPALSDNGQRHYRSVFKPIEQAFGDSPLTEVAYPEVAQWIIAHANAGKSAEWCKKLRNGLHAIYEHADACGLFHLRNPAKGVKIPRSARQKQKTKPYTLDELRAIVSALDSPLREMALLGAMTSLGGAELAGLRVGHLNRSSGPLWIVDRQVAAWSLYACETYSNGRYTRGKTEKRRRVLPIPESLLLPLEALAGNRPDDEPLFYMPRTAEIHKRAIPIDVGNVAKRVFRDRLGKQLGIRVTWHRFRATQATLADQMFADPDTKRRMLGHATEAMTEHYVDPLEKQRWVADGIGELLIGEAKGGVM